MRRRKKQETTYDFQSRGIAQVAEYVKQGSREVGIYYCTGSGKTVVSTLAALQAGFNHITVLTPMGSISLGFQKLGGQTWNLYGLDVPPIKVPHVKVFGKKIGYSLRNHLLIDNPQQIAVVNYSVLNEALPEDLTGKLLIADEGHHVRLVQDGDGTSWSHAIHKWLSRGGTVFYVSATPNTKRSCPFIKKSLVEMMILGLAPRDIYTDYLKVEDDTEQLALKVRERWETDGRPAVLIRVQRSSAENNSRTLEAILRNFQDSDVEVIDATGSEGKNILNNALAKGEDLRGKSFAKLPRVFVALVRMNEGTNAFWLSHVYFVGIPGSPLEFDQGLGRATRNKFDPFTEEPLFPDYPPAFLNAIHVTLFAAKELDAKASLIWLTFCQRMVSHQFAGRLMQSMAPPGALPSPKDPKSTEQVESLAASLAMYTHCLQVFTLEIRGQLPKGHPELEHSQVAEILKTICEAEYNLEPKELEDFRRHALAALRGNSSEREEPDFLKLVGHLYTEELIQRFRKDTRIVDTSTDLHLLDAEVAGKYSEPDADISEYALAERITAFVQKEGRYPLKVELIFEQGVLEREHQTTLEAFVLRRFGHENWFEALDNVLALERAGKNLKVSNIAPAHQDVPEVVYAPRALETVSVSRKFKVTDEIQKLTLEEAHRLGSAPREFIAFLRRTSGLDVVELRSILQESLTYSAPQRMLKTLLMGEKQHANV